MAIFRRSDKGPDLFGDNDSVLRSREFLIAGDNEDEAKSKAAEHVAEVVAPVTMQPPDLALRKEFRPDVASKVFELGVVIFLESPEPPEDGPESLAA